MNIKKSLIFVLVLIILSCSAYATTLVINMTQDVDYRDGYVSSLNVEDTASTRIFVGDTPAFPPPARVYRGFLDFNTTAIPDGSTITAVYLNLTYSTDPVANNVNVYGLNQTADSLIDAGGQATLYGMIGGAAGSTLYLNNDNTWVGAVNTPAGANLGANAVANLSSQLGADFFTVGIQSVNEVLDNWKQIYTDEDGTIAFEPKLTVEYTSPVGNALTVTLTNPNSNVTVNYNEFFNFSANVTCTGYCGDVNVSLDPFVPEVMTREKSLWERIVDWLEFLWTPSITGFVTANLVNTTIGAEPFYTNMSNPLTEVDFSCLNEMNDSYCEVYWWVNTTNATGTYEFFVFGNSSTLNSESNHINLTATDTFGPTVTSTAPVNESFTNIDVNMSYNVTDNLGVNSVDNCTIYTSVNGSAAVATNLSTAVTSSNDIPYTIGSDDVIEWFVRCTDNTSNTGVSENRTFYADKELPSISFGYPANDNSTVHSAASNLVLNVNLTDNHSGVSGSLKNATFWIINPSNAVVYTSTPSWGIGTAMNSFTDSIGVAAWPGGVYTLNLTGYDQAENSVQELRNFNLTAAPASTPSSGGGSSDPECDDNKDNDGDGLIDMDDPGCSKWSDDNETDPVVDTTEKDDKKCINRLQCTDWTECQEDGRMSRKCVDTSNCDKKLPSSIEYQKCDYAGDSDWDCKYEWNCSSWSECYENGTQYRDCIDMGEINPSEFCMSTAWKPDTMQRCSYNSPIEQEARNVCYSPWMLLALFVIAYGFLIFVVYRIDRYKISRTEVASLVNFAKLKANVLLVVVVLAAILYFHPCWDNNVLRFILLLLIIIAFCVVYVFYERYDYLDKGGDDKVDEMFEKFEELHSHIRVCPYCKMKFKVKEGYHYHVFICSLIDYPRKVYEKNKKELMKLFKR